MVLGGVKERKRQPSLSAAMNWHLVTEHRVVAIQNVRKHVFLFHAPFLQRRCCLALFAPVVNAGHSFKYQFVLCGPLSR